ncbi:MULTISPECIES: lytic transglycosylase domain-containing protein [unclassified Arthrobacter]|uniref:lytic transglycosylase domain-containing protein n=1 Tax=unclassified Arthrobacter TaxID=235627 RepID=UPI0014924AAC|nr:MULTISPECIES: lytic transglycosylase domain-containing protein [unclassified Arthrobacter]MBE0009880.1 LysM peptidoglycan-binding domain-containing protein [Arthrobacter sp. AET 35A]NOJ63780.1 LysM peptidoglycan-binding domain-containing protein [Arthrobacter sp. 147(2020)]
MTAQRPSSPLFGSQARARGTRLPSRFNIAVSTAAIPAMLFSAVALAQPASAAPVTVNAQQAPRLAPAVIVPAGLTSATGNVAARIPSFVAPAQSAPKTYTVKAGDTISGIALKHGVDTSSVLTANGLNASSLIHPGQKIKLSGAPASKPAAKPAEAAQPSAAAGYTVRAGDTLSAIAATHGVSLSTVLKANSLSMTSVIYPGQKLKLGGSAEVSVASTEIAPAAPKPAAPASTGSYTIKGGDTLGAIAAKHNVSLSALLKANKLSATTMIHPGKKLTIPGPAAPTTAPAAETAPPADLVPSTFLHYTYPQHVVSEANRNKHLLNSLPVPSNEAMKTIVADTARSMGVDPSLALAVSYQESGFNQRAVSPANAIGAMQVIPMSGEWASDLVGRKLNLLDPHDNATAGVAILKSLIRTSPNLEDAIASYYQGQYSVSTHGMFSDTKSYVAAIKSHQANLR